MLSTLILVLGKWTLLMLRCVAAATLWSCDLVIGYGQMLAMLDAY